MENLEKVTWCGLYCGLCAQGKRIPEQAAALQGTMKKENWDVWAAELPGFRDFWTFLDGLTQNGQRASCRGGTCGAPFCSIRKCASEKGIDACPFCDDYPCYRILGLAEGYVNLLGEGKRMKEKGLETWIAEQEERARTGFCYSDIRNYPYDIPE